MIKKTSFLFLLSLFLLSFSGQEFTLSGTIKGRYDLLTSDNLGNLYLVKGGVLEKYDASGKLVKTFSTKSLMQISSVDAGNAMKILLYFRSFSEVAFLDNTLSATSDPIALSQLVYQSPCVCNSYNSGLWLYDQTNFELFRVDQNLEGTHRSGNLSQVTGRSIAPEFITEYDNKVYLSDPENGILVFDVYGTYSRTIPIKKTGQLQVSGENIVYLKNRQVMSFNTRTLAQDSFPLPDTSATALRLEKNKLFLLCKEYVKIYDVK
jgi:hypothetical protein